MNTLREQLLEALEALRRTRANESKALPSDLFSADMRYFSSHRGSAAGRLAVSALIRDDFAGWEHVGIVVTNPVAKADDRLGVVSAYLLGEGSRAGNAILPEPAPQGRDRHQGAPERRRATGCTANGTGACAA